MRMSAHLPARYTYWVATRTLLLLALTLSAIPLSTALGQDESPAPRQGDVQARRLYSLGSDAFEAGRFSEAAVYFLQAYDVTPLPDLLFNAGAAHQRAEEDVEAVAVFERYLENHAGGSHQAEVGARLTVLRRRIAEPDESETVIVNTDAPDPRVSTSPEPSRVVPLALIIGGGVSVAAGATFLILAGGARSTVEDASGFYSSVESDDNRASTFGVVGGVALGVGAALAGVGVVLWATSGNEAEDEGASSGLRVGLGHAEWTTSW